MSIEDHYKFSRTLGQGGFAVVKLATAVKDNKQWACKIIKKTALKESDMSALKSEVNIMKICDHKNIVHLHEVFDTKQNLYLVMEVMRGGELFDRVVKKDHYSEREAQGALIQLLNALHYCHERNIVHRDLKPENLLYASPDDNDELKLADFGLASIVNQGELLHSACGTPNYVAPEILKTRGEGKHTHGYGKEVDIWSAGVILYILLCGFPPFYEDDSHVLFEQIETCSFEFISPYWDDISASAKDLIKNVSIPHHTTNNTLTCAHR